MTPEKRESIYELQKIDCNCNDCKFMERNFDKYNKSRAFHEGLQREEFEKAKEALVRNIADLERKTLSPDQKSSLKDLKRQYSKMKFQFDPEAVLINYGTCTKFSKPVAFIPNVCQLETQGCFQHRKG